MGRTDYQALLNDLRTKFREEKRQEFTRENILYLLDSLFEHLDRPPLSGPFGLLVHDRLLRHGWP